MKIAFGYKMRVGKDTAVDYCITKTGGKKLSFSTPLYEILNHAQTVCNFDKKKDRKFLQFVGTDWARSRDPDIWVKLLIEKAKTYGVSENIYISDLRFKNELDYLKKNGWICVKINKVKSPNLNRQESSHESETSLDFVPNNEWDYIIENNGTLNEYYIKLNQMIEHFGHKFI